MLSVRPNLKRAKIAIFFLWICVFLRFLALITSAMQLKIFLNTDLDYNYWNKDIGKLLLFDQILSIILIIVTIITIIYFIRWFRRAYFNLHCKVEGLEFSEAWAAGFWFIPIANLFQPYRIMKEMYLETNAYLANLLPDYKIRNYHTLLLAWWILWVCCSILNYINIKFSFDEPSIDQVIYMNAIEMAVSFILVSSGLLLIRIIKIYSRMEEKSHEIGLEQEGDISRHLAPELL
jgi:hypothetical protein